MLFVVASTVISFVVWAACHFFSRTFLLFSSFFSFRFMNEFSHLFWNHRIPATITVRGSLAGIFSHFTRGSFILVAEDEAPLLSPPLLLTSRELDWVTTCLCTANYGGLWPLGRDGVLALAWPCLLALACLALPGLSLLLPRCSLVVAPSVLRRKGWCYPNKLSQDRTLKLALIR